MIGIEINGGSGNTINGEVIDSSDGKKVVIDNLGNKTITYKDGVVVREMKKDWKRPALKSHLYDKFYEMGVDVSGFDRLEDEE